MSDTHRTAQSFTFLAVCDDVMAVTRVLETLHFKMPGVSKRRLHAVVRILPTGLRFTIEENQAFQANSFLRKDLFRIYEVNADHDCFKIPFDTLLDVLNIFGSSSPSRNNSLRLAYSKDLAENLLVVLSHGAGSVITTCKLRIMDCEPVMNIAEQMLQKKVNQIIMDASALKEAFGELDWSSDSVTLTLSNSAPYFQLSTSSAAGSCEVSYAKDSDAFSSFAVTCDQTARYKLSLLLPAARGLAEAHTASLKTNSENLLLIQMSIDLSSNHRDQFSTSAQSTAFVDYYIIPDIVDDDQPDDSEL